MKHLISNCAGKNELCKGCTESVKVGPNGRFYITMGHAGFNSATNNRDGYISAESAQKVVRFYTSLGKN